MIMHYLHNPKYLYHMQGERLLTTKEEQDIAVLVSDNMKPSAQCAKAVKTPGAV
jgi:hypothetical protein